MDKYVGLSWAPTGWLGMIVREDGSWETDHFPTIWSVWKYHSNATTIGIDIPFGLPATDKRACDSAAKDRLGERGRSVFYTPVRAAVYEQTLETAKTTTETQAGYSIQNQVWRRIPRLRELDEFLDQYPGAVDRLIEVQPEVAFSALNGETPVPPRDTEAGYNRRRALLAEEQPVLTTIIDTARDRYLSPPYASFLNDRADILDGAVTAATAMRPPTQRARLPTGTPIPRDERGLPMTIQYPETATQSRLSTLSEQTGINI